MNRMLSLGVAVIIAVLVIPAMSVTGQDAESCQKAKEKCSAAQCGNCQAIEFELVGVDLPSDGKKTKKREISIQVSCNCDVPFLSNLPMLNHVFGTVTNEECDVIVVGHTDDESCCGSCDSSCCSKEETNDNVCVCESGVPFHSNLPYVNRLFKNVGVCDGDCNQECQEASCTVACQEESCCPAGKCPAFSFEASASPACPHGTWVQLASHHEAAAAEGPSRSELYEALMESHAENASLEARLEAMEHHIAMMEEMGELRAENAALQARLEMMEEQKATTAAWHVHPGTAHGNVTVLGLPHPPHAPHAKASSVGTTLTPQAGIKVKVPAARAAIFAHEMPEPTEVQRMAEHVRILKKIKQQQSKCSQEKSTCTKEDSK